MIVLDASAALAFLSGEPGSDEVERALEAGPTACSAADWSEVAQKILAAGRDWDAAASLLRSYGLSVEPVTVDDAEWAARDWLEHRHLSLGDRLCLALARRLGADALTADHAWGDAPGVRQLRR
ncbi:MAG: PIN domain-containing protein [Actinomycetia bacterium]|nr:PIN domain-containing protein [Actinomycetes bacterium]